MPRIGDTLKAVAQAMRLLAMLIPLLGIMNANAHAAPQRPVDANTAASIVDSSPLSQNPPSQQEESPVSAAVGAPITPPVSPIVVPPASETRMLGRPNAPPVRSTDAAPLGGGDVASGESSSSEWLGAFDPRRSELTRVLGALAAVIGLILLARTLAVRYMPGFAAGKGDRPSGVIEVLARYPLGRGQQLLVLKFARRILLIHQAGTVARTLTEMTNPDEVAATLARLEAGASAGSARRFREELKSFENEHQTVAAQRSRDGASLAATETEIIDLTRTQIRGIGGITGARRMLR